MKNPSSDEVSSSAPPMGTFSLADHENGKGGLDDMDTHSVSSVRSMKSVRYSASSSSSSLRISAMAKRVALLTEASKLKEKHAIEEQE